MFTKVIMSDKEQTLRLCDKETEDILDALRSSHWMPDTEVPEVVKGIIDRVRPKFISRADWMRE